MRDVLDALHVRAVDEHAVVDPKQVRQCLHERGQVRRRDVLPGARPVVDEHVRHHVPGVVREAVVLQVPVLSHEATGWLVGERGERSLPLGSLVLQAGRQGAVLVLFKFH